MREVYRRSLRKQIKRNRAALHNTDDDFDDIPFGYNCIIYFWEMQFSGNIETEIRHRNVFVKLKQIPLKYIPTHQAVVQCACSISDTPY